MATHLSCYPLSRPTIGIAIFATLLPATLCSPTGRAADGPQPRQPTGGWPSV